MAELVILIFSFPFGAFIPFQGVAAALPALHQKQAEHEKEDYVVEQLVEVLAAHEHVEERDWVGHFLLLYEPGVVVGTLDFLGFTGEAELCP